MENCSFQSQLLSVMEVLAKAAVAEINRRVDDSCAVLRLEVSRSRRDIDLLKRKCDVMEAELRRTRVRAKKRVFHPPAAERLSPLVKVVLNKERQSSDWDRQEDAEVQPQQRADMEPANEAEHLQIKEECSEDDMWKNNPEDKLISGAEEPPCFNGPGSVQTDNFVNHCHSPENNADDGPSVSPCGGYDMFSEQKLNVKQNETGIIVKHEKEEEPNENAAPLDSGNGFMTRECDGEMWSSRDPGDSSFLCAGQQFDQIPTVFTPQSSLHLQDMVPRIHSVGKSVMPSAARTKRRIRTFGCKRPQADEGHTALSQINAIDQSLIAQQSQHQYRDSAPHLRNTHNDLMAPNPAASTFRGHSRTSFSLVRKMRTPWMSSMGEKRFSCTYCDKSFMRFSQLKEHLRSHTGEKPFSCLQCGRSFTKQCNLIRHAVVHSGEKPYECSLCGKCFTQRSSLKSHQKTAH